MILLGQDLRDSDELWQCISGERPDMKKTRSAEKSNDPSQLAQGIPFPEAKENHPADDSLNLSPERIMEGASTTTPLMEEILALPEEVHPSRHWGINE